MNRLIATYKGHYKALFYLGLPIVIGQMGVIVLGFADTLMVGHHSTAELAAASFTNNLFTLCIIFSTGFSYGLTPVVGEFYGNRRFMEAGQALRSSLLANVLVALLLTLIMTVVYFCVEYMGQPEELIPLIKPYFLVLLASLVFVMLFNGFKQFTDGITQTQTAMWVLLGGNTLNIIGNYILIYGKFGFPELGLLGAGISTLFSRIVMVIVFALVIFRSRRFLRYKAGFFRLGMVKTNVQEIEWTWVACRFADGHGDGVIQPQYDYGRLAGNYCFGVASDYAYYFSVHLYDVLWDGGGNCRSRQ